MPVNDKSKRRTTDVTVRIRPSTKTLLEKRAAEERRSITNYLERLITADAGKNKRHYKRGLHD